MKYIVAQIIGILAFGLSLFAYHRKKKKYILSNMVISNSLNLVHYLLLGAYSGCVTKIIAIFRDLFIILKDKYKWLSKGIFLVGFLLIYVIVGIVIYDGIISLFPLIAAVIYIILIWNRDELIVKKAAFFSYFLWLIYNIFVFSIAGIISNIVSIFSLIVAILRNDIKRSSEG